jgi:N-acetylglucosaminyldiphosphoundecaprenol N-acetyl-beta-D-mannosaminyltransferase
LGRKSKRVDSGPSAEAASFTSGVSLPVGSVKHYLGPVEFIACSPLAACDYVLALSREHIGRHVHLSNAYTVALADKTDDYRKVLGDGGINFPDGKPLSWMSVLKRQSPVLQQVRGPQLFLDVFDRGRLTDTKHFLLGSTPEVLSKLESNLIAAYPGVKIVGVESPPFRSLSSDEQSAQDQRILDSEADLVWVGLGTPKQDIESRRIAESLPVVAVAIGAAFDFAAGTARTAPEWMTRVGLEWVFRFSQEPKRLWKRYVFGNSRFLVATVLRTKKR